MDSARPIETEKDDAFSRLPFAKHLASFLCLDIDEPSIVGPSLLCSCRLQVNNETTLPLLLTNVFLTGCVELSSRLLCCCG